MSNDLVIPDPEEQVSAEDVLYRALESGSYIVFIGRLDHRGDNGIKWSFREKNFPRDDWRQAAEMLVRLMDRAREKERLEQEAALRQ